MDLSPSTLFKLLLPLTPLLLKTIIFNVLSLSKNSSKQSTRVEVTIAIIRELINRKSPLGKVQSLSVRDPGIKGPLWIAKASLPSPPETEARDALLSAIKELGIGNETFSPPDYTTVTGEWTGWRANVSKTEPRPSSPESEQYISLMKEVTSPVTILYFHGGGYVAMDPASHRAVTSQLAKRTSGRVFSVRYRLAPQHSFPNALLDALLSYLYLLSPPEGSFHSSISANNIVFSGDSAGGNLSFSLNLLILTLNRMGISSLPYHGKNVSLTSPAGIAGNSPWLDIANSLPSLTINAHYDYLFPPTPEGIPTPTSPPPDHIWPTSPPCAELYCSASLLKHPLVSPICATPSMWQNSPPIFICVGEEGLTDGCTITARRMHQGGANVVFAGYEGMPHCFAMIFPTTPSGRDCFTRWTNFITNAVANTVPRSDTGTWTKALTNPPQSNEVPLDKLTDISDDKLKELVDAALARATKREEEEVQKWEVEKAKAKL